jgi:hypothetical protein
LRLAGLPPLLKAETVAKVLEDHAPELHGVFSVVSPGAVRIRRSPQPGASSQRLDP